MQNIDEQEIAKFDADYTVWWDKQGPYKMLHTINPLRFGFIESFAELKDKKLVDIGCGGGILTESLAKEGVNTTAIDINQNALAGAIEHAKESQLSINYVLSTAENFAEDNANQFDIVTCMELLEHVPDPESLIKAIAELLKPGGKAFFSTLNRNPKSYLLAVIGGEYILNLLPKGTHDYAKFIKPFELNRWCASAGLHIKTSKGMNYSPLTGQCKISDDTSVNYLAYAEKND